MLDLESGPVHLSVEEGIGGTSLCLSIAAKILQSNSRVIWLGRKTLNSERTRAIFTELDETQLERFFMMEFGDNLLHQATALKSLINRLTETDLVVIDDWCPSSGRAPANDLEAARSLISSAEHTRLILTSKAYESPSGDGDKWKSRGAQLSGVRQVWLLRHEGFRNYRRIIDGDIQTRLLLKESGFVPD